MGNQECSIQQAPECLKDLPGQPFRWDKAEKSFAATEYQTADGTAGTTTEGSRFGSRSTDDPHHHSRALSVESVDPSGRRKAAETPAEEAALDVHRSWEAPPTHTVGPSLELAQAPKFEAVDMSLRFEGSTPMPTPPLQSLTPLQVHQMTEATENRPPKTYFECEAGERPNFDDIESLGVPIRRRHVFRTGAVYDGEWFSYMREGVGKQTWPDGTEYVGEWSRGRANGLGQIRHKDGDTYSGEWVNGRAHGCGVYSFQGGAASYEGEFQCDHREGFGVEKWTDGSCYQGEFRQGEKNGHGENTWPDGTKYVGSWKANALSGAGYFSVHDGTNFQGQWENSTPHGIGKYSWPSGKAYEGKYQFDKKHGFGILSEADGTERQGYWVRGELTNRKS